MSGPVVDDVEQVFRTAYGQAVATLVRVFGDITAAEDAVQDAFVVAAERWPKDGVPPNPAGWIVTTARRRAIDSFRRTARGTELERDAQAIGAEDLSPDAESFDGMTGASLVPDDQLRLIFTCCHPSLRSEHQVALTLRLLGGLSVDEVARSFLVSEAAMARRLGRAKYKIKAANIPYRVPAAPDLAQRVSSVLSVISLIYNTGADTPEAPSPLRSEAIRLARALVVLMPQDSEALGLLALLVLNESRVEARTRIDGSLVVLSEQDRTRWDRTLIEEGHTMVRDCIERDRPGPFQLQAAIQAVHCHAGTYGDTDWPQIVLLYDHLFSLLPTPVVAMNRAIARAETDGPAVAIEELRALDVDLDGYHLFHATRANLLRRLDRNEAAELAYRRALDLAPNDRQREFLLEQLDRVPKT